MRTSLLVVMTILAPLAARAQGVGRPGEERRRFDAPRINGRAVDRCLNWGENCDQPAADNFCRLNGYAAAINFRFVDMRPTLVVGDNTVCDQDGCRGFTTITCEGRAQRSESGDQRRFDSPRINGRAVDRCLNWGENCDQPAADNFCRLNGYAGAVNFRFVDMRPTLVVGDNTLCDQDGCRGFTTITCEGRGERPDQGGRRRFDNPRIDGRAVDRCLNWGENCEKPAADNFCRLRGFSAATVFEFVPMRPTLVVGDNTVCDQDGCQGFTTITCR